MEKSVSSPGDKLYGFGAFVADPVRRQLLHRGIELPLTHKTFALLVELLRRPGDVVEKTDLMTSIWADVIVEENNLARTVSMLRKVLHDVEPGVDFVTTVTGVGYRFVAPVQILLRGERAPASLVVTEAAAN